MVSYIKREKTLKDLSFEIYIYKLNISTQKNKLLFLGMFYRKIENEYEPEIIINKELFTRNKII